MKAEWSGVIKNQIQQKKEFEEQQKAQQQLRKQLYREQLAQQIQIKQSKAAEKQQQEQQKVQEVFERERKRENDFAQRQNQIKEIYINYSNDNLALHQVKQIMNKERKFAQQKQDYEEQNDNIHLVRQAEQNRRRDDQLQKKQLSLQYETAIKQNKTKRASDFTHFQTGLILGSQSQKELSKKMHQDFQKDIVEMIDQRQKQKQGMLEKKREEQESARRKDQQDLERLQMQKKHFQQKVKEYDEYNKHMDEQKKMNRKHNSEMHSIELQLNKQEVLYNQPPQPHIYCENYFSNDRARQLAYIDKSLNKNVSLPPLESRQSAAPREIQRPDIMSRDEVPTRKSVHVSQDSRRSNLTQLHENLQNQQIPYQRSVTTKDHVFRIDYNAPLKPQSIMGAPRAYNIISGL